MTVDAASRASETSLRVTVARGIAYYYLTSLVVFLAVVAGATLLVRSHYALPHAGGFAGHFAYGNGGDYVAVAQDGYDFDPRAQSYVAFFPVFPLLGRGVMRLTGVEPQVALVLVSNAALAGAFVALLAYARLRMADAPPDAAEFALLALGLYPAGVFFRMAYTESTFLLVAVLAMYALARPWPLWIAALLVGWPPRHVPPAWRCCPRWRWRPGRPAARPHGGWRGWPGPSRWAAGGWRPSWPINYGHLAIRWPSSPRTAIGGNGRPSRGVRSCPRWSRSSRSGASTTPRPMCIGPR
jgi:hypothetical protein